MLKSETVVIESPMSFVGSAKRALKILGLAPDWNPAGAFTEKVLFIATIVTLTIVVALIIVAWWAVIVCWYLIFGILVIPWRLIRRSQRKEKKRELQHRELLNAMQQKEQE